MMEFTENDNSCYLSEEGSQSDTLPVVPNNTHSDLFVMCHASEIVVQNPDWSYVNPKNIKAPEDRDFGAGFYTCEKKDLWYPVSLYSKFEQVYLNEYTFDITGLRVLHLETNLIWVLIVAAHRHAGAGSKASWKQQWSLLREAILKVIDHYDMIIGPISNDRMYSALDDFIDNLVSEEYIIEAVNYMKYPLQYVSKSPKADKQFKYVCHQELSPSELQTSKEARLSSDSEMIRTMIQRRAAEKAKIKNGKLTSRLFKDLVVSCFIGIEDATDEHRRQHVESLVKEWLSHGRC